jgi:hypothetical protein
MSTCTSPIKWKPSYSILLWVSNSFWRAKRVRLISLIFNFSFFFLRTKNEIFSSRGTGEEACLGVIDSFLDLSKTLRKLNGLPLEITSTQGTSAVFRYSALFPSLPHVHIGMKKSLASDDKSMFFKDGGILQHTPLYVDPIDGKLYRNSCILFLAIILFVLNFLLIYVSCDTIFDEQQMAKRLGSDSRSTSCLLH